MRLPRGLSGKSDACIGSVMTAYNWINGQACAHNEQLIDGTLRAKWKFDGVVVSDWGVYTIRLLH